ncbi:phage tail P2-like protein [Paraburkholderia unamae]|uniref:phage tail protein I n=1 Tax=Paraburkholderia unamae TaxID=219649 RepID=UPI000DC3641C|nr:phage tail protein I [Paraburkholderia unamae]RAR53898.1 phage tail P2-like protein [Paraburkholderia unamae]
MADFVSLVPPNATTLERRLEQVNAAIEEIPVPVRSMWNADTFPANALPWLAWGFGVELWDSEWSEEQKRAAIKNSLFVKKHKGTIGAVKRALAALGYDVEIQEWFNQIPLGAPYTFDALIDASQVAIDEEGLMAVLQLIDAYKNLRLHMRKATLSVTTRSQLCVAATTVMGQQITIPFDGPKYSDGSFAYDLVLDALEHGEPSTVEALDGIDKTVRQTMPNDSWKEE